jgi:hypothetical protein
MDISEINLGDEIAKKLGNGVRFPKAEEYIEHSLCVSIWAKLWHDGTNIFGRILSIALRREINGHL